MLTILDNGLRFTDTLQYAWFHLQKDDRTFYRAIALKELAVIPVDVREDYDLLGKTWAAVRGLHNAGVNFAKPFLEGDSLGKNSNSKNQRMDGASCIPCWIR